MLLGIVKASLLENVLAGKDKIRVCKGTLSVKIDFLYQSIL